MPKNNPKSSITNFNKLTTAIETGKSGAISTQSFPFHFHNGFSSGGEIIEILIINSKVEEATLLLQDGTRKEIRTPEDARQALEMVAPKNQQDIENFLITNKVISRKILANSPEHSVVDKLFSNPTFFNQKWTLNPAISLGFTGSANGFQAITFPKFTVNGIESGGEKLEIVQSRVPTQITLILADGTRKKIRMHGEAQEALKLVCQEHHSLLKELLIQHKLLASTLEDLKKNNLAINKLYLKINKLKEHAFNLAEVDPERKTAAVSLADRLEEKANLFLTNTLNNLPTQQEFEQFENEFKKIADSSELLIGRHRAIWKPILANILLALTGIGAILILGRLIYKAATSSNIDEKSFNNSFFFAQTNLQYHKNQVKNCVHSDLVSFESAPAPSR